MFIIYVAEGTKTSHNTEFTQNETLMVTKKRWNPKLKPKENWANINLTASISKQFETLWKKNVICEKYSWNISGQGSKTAFSR